MSNPPCALVTGGGRGLGQSIAFRLASDGLRVGVLARTREEVESTAQVIIDSGGEALPLVANVLDEVEVVQAVDRLRSWGGRLSVVVHSAGCFRSVGRIEDSDGDQWWTDLATTLLGARHLLACTLAQLQAGGPGTFLALVGPGFNDAQPHGSAYFTAQAGLARLVECVHREARQNRQELFTAAVFPGIVMTELIRHLVDDPSARRLLPRFNEVFAEGKEVQPATVAEMVSWLVATRPAELSGRVLHALMTPELLEARLARIQDEDQGVLRLR